jgi:hypothetical protein
MTYTLDRDVAPADIPSVHENGQPSTNDTPGKTDAEQKLADEANEKLIDYMNSVLEDCKISITDLRRKLGYTYWIIIAMCISMFVLGFAFISLPLWRQPPITQQGWLDIVLPAGVGIANLLALYLYKPLERIQKLMADMSQLTVTFNSFQTQVALYLIGTKLEQRETMGEAAGAVNTTAEIILKQICDYFEEIERTPQ